MKQLLKSVTTQSDGNSDSDPTNNNSTDHSEKTFKSKGISKTSPKINVEHLVHLEKEQRKKLSKQQKHEIQRLKNKEAAQKSRDQRKIHIELLQKTNADLLQQNSRLKEEISHLKKYCWKCKMQVQNQEVNSQDYMVEQPQLIIDEPNRIQLFDNDIGFQRVPNFNKSSTDFFSCLFLITIALAVFMPGDFSKTNQISLNSDLRLLTQVRQFEELPKLPNKQQSYPLAQIVKQNEVDIYKIPQIPHLNQTSLINYLSDDSQICIKNLLKKQNSQGAQLAEKNLRYGEDDSKDVLFCHLPKVFKEIKQQGGFLSRVFDIILKADEIQRIILAAGGNSIGLESFPYEGLYALTVEIQSIKKYGSEDCLMDYL